MLTGSPGRFGGLAGPERGLEAALAARRGGHGGVAGRRGDLVPPLLRQPLVLSLKVKVSEVIRLPF